jgi:3-polyprenyl-4-hydroxybenzoate decarboxylase
MALNTLGTAVQDVSRVLPEFQAVNAMYTHGIGVIVSTGVRLAVLQAVAMRMITTPHGLAYNKIIIVVDDLRRSLQPEQ